MDNNNNNTNPTQPGSGVVIPAAPVPPETTQPATPTEPTAPATSEATPAEPAAPAGGVPTAPTPPAETPAASTQPEQPEATPAQPEAQPTPAEPTEPAVQQPAQETQSSPQPAQPAQDSTAKPGMNKMLIIAGVGIGMTALTIGAFTLKPNTQTLNSYKEVKKHAPVVTKAAEPTEAEVRDEASGMTLTVIAPQDKTIVSKASLIVQGVTSPNAEVFVNDVKLSSGTTGSFSTPVTLDEGENEITVTVNDANGNYAEKTVRVDYEPATTQ